MELPVIGLIALAGVAFAARVGIPFFFPGSLVANWLEENIPLP